MIVTNYRGTNYNVPEPANPWTQSLTNFLVALGQTAISAGLVSDADFGTLFGVAAIYFRSKTANPAHQGVLRLAFSDVIGFRNAANSGDVFIGLNSANQPTFNNGPFGALPFVAAMTTASPSIPNSSVTTVVFPTVEADTDSAYNLSTGVFTVPSNKGGQYLLYVEFGFGAPIAGVTALIFKNGAEIKRGGTTNSPSGSTINAEALLVLAPADQITFRVFQASGGAASLSSATPNNYFFIKALPT